MCAFIGMQTNRSPLAEVASCLSSRQSRSSRVPAARRHSVCPLLFRRAPCFHLPLSLPLSPGREAGSRGPSRSRRWVAPEARLPPAAQLLASVLRLAESCCRKDRRRRKRKTKTKRLQLHSHRSLHLNCPCPRGRRGRSWRNGYVKALR